jgi:hypothetical protein
MESDGEPFQLPPPGEIWCAQLAAACAGSGNWLMLVTGT